MAEIMDAFKTILVVMLFYSMSITLLSYAMPSESLKYVDVFSEATESITLESVSADVQDSLQSQTDIPVIELGSLIFHSGNILIDLILNFVFAIPEMLGLLIHGVTMLLNIDSYIFVVVELFASVAVLALYIVGLMQLLVGLRTSQVL